MTIEQRLDILDNRFADCRETFTAKGKSYAGNDDALFNFKQVANMTGQTVFQVWASYFMKHVLSLTNAVKDNPSNPVDKSEGNDGRVTDVINYAVLFECLSLENQGLYVRDAIDEMKERNKDKETALIGKLHPLLQTPSPEVEKAVIKDFERTLENDRKFHEELSKLISGNEESLTDITIKNICSLLDMDFDKENKLEMIQTILNVYYTSKGD